MDATGKPPPQEYISGGSFSRGGIFLGRGNTWDTGGGGRCLKHKFRRGDFHGKGKMATLARHSRDRQTNRPTDRQTAGQHHCV